jgi:hypothetical protein
MASRRAARWFLAALVSAPSIARAAPEPTAVAHVLELASDFEMQARAQTLTNLLRLRVGDSGDYLLASQNPSLVVVASAVRCDVRGFGAGALREDADRSIDERCLRSMSVRLDAERYFWGHLYTGSDGKLWVKAHLWQRGQASRTKALPYDEATRDRLVGRLYLHLVHPGQAADVRIDAPSDAAGELYVDGAAQGPYAPGLETTLRAGEHAFELRREGRVLARASAVVAAGKANGVRLELVPRTDLDPSVGFHDPPPIEATPRGEWKRTAGFVGLGIGAAGLLGAGAFFALRQGKQSDLDDLCQGRDYCPREAQSDLDRSNRWGTLSLVSLGVGAASTGVGAFFLLTAPRSRPNGATTSSVRLGAVPLIGGAFTTLTLKAF